MRAPTSLLICLGLASCDANWWEPAAFVRAGEQAPVVLVPDPGGGELSRVGYGSVVVGYGTLLPALRGITPGTPPNLLASRFAVSGGASTAFHVWRGFEDRLLDASSTTGLRPALDEGALYDACRERDFCGDGASASLAAFEVLPGGLRGGGDDDLGCIAAPAGTVDVGGVPVERLNLRCETNTSIVRPLDVPPGVAFGASAAGLPAVRGDGCAPAPHPLGLALFGAPGVREGTGALYALTAGLELREVPLDGLDLPAGASLGAALAVGRLPDGALLVAVAARSEGGPAPQVIVASLRESGGAIGAQVHACLRGGGPGLGRALAVGDLDGDGVPELAIGGGAPEAGRAGGPEEPVQLYAFSALADLRLAGCLGDAAPAPARAIACADVEGLTCSAADRAPSGFGAALAIGDLDGDGVGDLVVGAPHALSGGVASGVVVSLAGASELARLGAGAGRQAMIAPSNARSGMRLGAAVATLPGTDRDEIVAGAPGASTAALFFCSGLAGDRPADLAGTSGVRHGCVVPLEPGRPPECGRVSPRDAGTEDGGGLADGG